MTNFRNIPTSSQWVTFPVSSKEKLTINWEDDFHAYVNTYYVAKCYFGIPEQELQTDSIVDKKLQVPNPVFCKGGSKLTVLGETKIYIAAEFIEEEYAESLSDLHQFHLKDIAIESGASEKFPWVTMKLNGAFCYGQNGTGDKLRRYIIYHPSIGPGIQRPNIHQHRFTDTEITNTIRKGLEGATDDMPENYKFLGAALGQLIKVLHKKGKAALGDALWVFLDDHQLTGVNTHLPRDEASLRTHLGQIQTLEFGDVGMKAKLFKRTHLLAPPLNQQPFVPPIPSASSGQQEHKPEEVLREKPQAREDLEMSRADEIFQEVHQILQEIEEEHEKAGSTGSRHTHPPGTKVDQTQKSINALLGANTGMNKASTKDTSLHAIFGVVRPDDEDEDEKEGDETLGKGPKKPAGVQPVSKRGSRLIKK
ncbi:hypothetical protein N7454_003216 [Penicillium verhagenii]|nr:hypothetical protein N7454_003216 [Penicillium verhagenii]